MVELHHTAKCTTAEYEIKSKGHYSRHLNLVWGAYPGPHQLSELGYPHQPTGLAGWVLFFKYQMRPQHLNLRTMSLKTCWGLCEVAKIPDEHNNIKEELQDLITQLKAWKHILGSHSQSMRCWIGERSERLGSVSISLKVETLAWSCSDGLGWCDIEEVSSNSDDDKPEVVPPSINDAIETCQKLEGDRLLVCTEGALKFVESGCQPWGHLQKISWEWKTNNSQFVLQLQVDRCLISLKYMPMSDPGYVF